MSAALLRRARWAYGSTFGICTGTAYVWVLLGEPPPPGYPDHRRRQRVLGTRRTIRGMSSLLAGPGGPA